MNSSSPGKPQTLDKPILLIGEGQEEVRFFKALLEHLDATNLQVEDYGGKYKLKPWLDALKKRSGFDRLDRLGITGDADVDCLNAKTSLRDKVRSAAFPDKLRVSFFVLPNDREDGALETLCLKSQAGDPVTRCINDYFKCVEAADPERALSQSEQDKASIHAWLAAQVPPDLRLGVAASKGFLRWDSVAFDPLKQFLVELSQ